MRPQGAAVAAKTIDMLILETLACGVPATARELSRTWGGDRTRIEDYLDKFTKLGLIEPAGHFFGEVQYKARPVRPEPPVMKM